jgi:hypothetical protein
MVWDVPSGKPATILDGYIPVQEGGGRDMSFSMMVWSPDGSKIASSNSENTVTVWDVASGRPALDQPLEGHSEHVCSMAWSPDGSKVIAERVGEWVGDDSSEDTCSDDSTILAVLAALNDDASDDDVSDDDSSAAAKVENEGGGNDPGESKDGASVTDDDISAAVPCQQHVRSGMSAPVLEWNAATGELVPDGDLLQCWNEKRAVPAELMGDSPAAVPLGLEGPKVLVPGGEGGAGGGGYGDIVFTCDLGSSGAMWMPLAPARRNIAGQMYSAVACVATGSSMAVLHLIGEDIGDGMAPDLENIYNEQLDQQRKDQQRQREKYNEQKRKDQQRQREKQHEIQEWNLITEERQRKKQEFQRKKQEYSERKQREKQEERRAVVAAVEGKEAAEADAEEAVVAEPFRVSLQDNEDGDWEDLADDDDTS